MSIAMFIVGFVIFSIYMYLTIWNIFYSARKQREENYPNLDGMGNEIDYDGTYYERHSVQYRKRPKIKKGSQSRKKSYKIDNIVKKK